MQFFARIIDGKFIMDRRKTWWRWCETRKQNSAWTVEILPPKKKRSTQANGYYWAVLGELSEYTGYTPTELHEGFKARFLSREDERGILVGGSTKTMDSGKFVQHIEQCAQWCAESLDWIWPEPQELGYDLKSEK